MHLAKKLTHFDKKVYTVVKNIPFGEVRTYKWVAEKIGLSKASRAVGNALNKNPFPIIVPCHRVVNSSGNLGKYAFGADLKKKLLELERAKNAI
jgi:methylated-DNA-[protein]-cysteine S-methyltransferase